MGFGKDHSGFGLAVILKGREADRPGIQKGAAKNWMNSYIAHAGCQWILETPPGSAQWLLVPREGGYASTKLNLIGSRFKALIILLGKCPLALAVGEGYDAGIDI